MKTKINKNKKLEKKRKLHQYTMVYTLYYNKLYLFHKVACSILLLLLLLSRIHFYIYF